MYPSYVKEKFYRHLSTKIRSKLTFSHPFKSTQNVFSKINATSREETSNTAILSFVFCVLTRSNETAKRTRGKDGEKEETGAQEATKERKKEETRKKGDNEETWRKRTEARETIWLRWPAAKSRKTTEESWCLVASHAPQPRLITIANFAPEQETNTHTHTHTHTHTYTRSRHKSSSAARRTFKRRKAFSDCLARGAKTLAEWVVK